MRFFQSKTAKESQNNSSKERGSDLDRLYAVMRRMAQRIAQLETQLSTVRRDVNRIDKKIYRSDGDASQVYKQVGHSQLPSGESTLPDIFMGV
jgi:hypothetical protein